jgi:quinoprotein glucose dehydrogenase
LISDPSRFPADTTNKVQVLATDAITASISSVAPETGSTTPYEQLFQRVINANFRLGQKQNAAALANFATDERAPASLRVEALQCLADWPQSSGRDRIVGLWRPLPSRPKTVAERELTGIFKSLFPKTPKVPDAVQLAAIEAVQKLGITKLDSTLLSLIRGNAPSTVRVASLKTLASLKSKRLEDALSFAEKSGDATLVSETRLVRARLNPDAALPDLTRVLAEGPVREKQQVLGAVAQIPSPKFADLVESQMRALLKGAAPAELELDILDAASKQATPQLLALVQQFESRRPATPTAPFREVLHGGDANAGRSIFFERAEVFCSRCHVIGSEGGMAGPNLTGIGARASREYILESIIAPNKDLAKGFENVLVTTKDGTSVSGLVEKETDTELFINSPEDGDVHLKKSEIKSRERALSGMPEEFRQILTKQDLRNLIEFLASQKEPPK